jgi:hypothetical protein
VHVAKTGFFQHSLFAVESLFPGTKLGGERRGFIPGRKNLEGVIFAIINN